MSTNWLQQLPKGWMKARLKAVVDLKAVRGSETSFAENYVGLENIEPWTGRLLRPEPIPDVSDDENELNSTVSYFEPGDVLFGKLRPYLAKAHLANESGICTTELLVLKPNPNLNGKFLLDVILTPQFIEQVNAETFGAKMPRANWDTISNISIPLPPLPEQRAIANYLDRQTAKLDTLIAAKERLLNLLAEKRRALITHTVTRGLNPDTPMCDSGVEWLREIPAHWQVVRLRRVLTSMDYGISESVGPEGKIAVLRMGDVSDGEIIFDNVGFVDEVDSGLLLNPGDLLFNRTNSLALVGKVGLFRDEFTFPTSFASYLVRLRCDEMVLSEYLNYILNSSPILTWARSEALPAIGQANLNPNRYSYLLNIISIR